MTPQEMVREFHDTFGLAVDSEDTPELRNFRFDLIDEEYEEVWREMYGEYNGPWFASKPPGTLEDVAKELADLVYVTYGTAVSLGIDLDETFRRVHASNMSKREPDGTVNRDASGKVLKNSNYEPPDMTGVVR